MVHLTDPTPVYLRKRYLIVFLVFLGYINLYTLRVNMSTAIVAMTNNSTGTADFDWSSQAKGYALSSFFYGYITTQIAGGVLASRIGGHWVFGLGVLGTALMTLVTPVMAHQGIGYLIASRVIQGVLSGLAYPAINSIYSKYSPPIERSRTVSYGVSGIYTGTIIANLLSGWIGDNLGWEWIFYIFGIAAVVWYVLWYLVVKAGPETDTFMTKSERDFIRESLERENLQNVRVKYPWKKMFTSMPVIAIAIAHFSYNWGYYTMLTQLPAYMNDILKFDLTSSGILSALPYIVQTAFVYFTGFFADWVQKRGWLNTTQVRKTFNTIGLFSQMGFLLVAAFVSNTTAIIACISMSVGIGAFAMSGWLANTLDIAPQFSGIILGISNTFATIAGILSPIVTGNIATTPNASEYRIVFSITCGIYLFGLIFFIIFASGEMQPWAFMDAKETENSENEVQIEKEKEENEKKSKL